MRLRDPLRSGQASKPPTSPSSGRGRQVSFPQTFWMGSGGWFVPPAFQDLGQAASLRPLPSMLRSEQRTSRLCSFSGGAAPSPPLRSLASLPWSMDIPGGGGAPKGLAPSVPLLGAQAAEAPLRGLWHC